MIMISHKSYCNLVIGAMLLITTFPQKTKSKNEKGNANKSKDTC